VRTLTNVSPDSAAPDSNRESQRAERKGEVSRWRGEVGQWAFLEDAPVGIHWVDANGTITWANRAELEMLGYSPDDYIGRHIAEFHVDPHVIADILQRLQRGETLHNYEARLRHKDGSIRYGAINSNVLWEDGKFVHTRCFTRDITERKCLEEKSRAQFDELENIYRTAPIGLALIDKAFRFARINARLAEINGIPAEQHLGRSLREIVPTLADQAEAVFRRVFDTGEAVLNVEFAGETQAQPGVRRVRNESWHPLKNATGETIAINVVVEEITERKRAEAALAESVRQKEALYQLADSLQRTKLLADVYRAALQAIISALPCDRASILLFDDAGVMRFVGWRGLSDGYRQAVEGHSPWHTDETNPQPICIGDVDAAAISEALKATVKAEGIGALAFIPLVTDGKLIGKFMAYFDAPHVFRAEELELSLTIARQLAFAIERQRAEAALRESERRFRAMIDALPAAIYTTDAAGRLTHFNPAAVEFAGHVPTLGTDRWCVSWKLYATDGTRLPHEQCPMAVSLKEGRVVRGAEAIAELPDGTRRWFEPYPTPLQDAGGRLVGGINMLVDITERKRAEELLRNHARQLALITDTAPVFIAYCDTESRFKFVNKAYAARFGLRPEDCVGKRIPDIVGEQAYASFRQYVDAVLRGEAVEFDVAIPYTGLGERFMHCSYAPEFDAAGNVVGWVAAITDITERRHIEEALRASEEGLKEADRRKDEFLAMLAHELRNPLAPIANAVHLLRHDRSENRVRQQARAIIERQTARLARLVDELLEVSRITTGRIRLHLERIAIGGIVERAVETVRPLIEQHRHILAVSLPPAPLWLYADAARLEQVLVNLLNNAAKYTDDGGRIDLTVQSEESDVLLRVRDTGIGIEPELLPRVFDLFTQAERSLDRSRGGLGIGLSLVQRLVSMHGGSVVAKSVVGQGSEFTVRLPLSQMSVGKEHAAARQIDGATGRPLCVLVVDDNIDAAQSLAMLLEVAGHVVWLAHDGVAALEAVGEYRPHVVFLDIGLPKLDGYEVAKRLHADSATANIVLVAMTGYGQAADRERARDAGFDCHLVKPVDFSDVERVLAEIPHTRPN
jgi:PAS domain S-box-containing protein